MTLKRLSLSLLLALPLIAHADTGVTVSLDPPYPTPYQTVQVTLTGYSFDLNVAQIVWSSRGKVLLSGLGKKTISLQLGDVGTSIPLSYTVTAAGGASTSGDTVLSPQSVDLLYESKESHTPPFYEGKALPGEGSVVRVAAFPSLSDGAGPIAPSNLSYAWYINEEYKENLSGVGKSSASVALDYLQDSTDVRVLVRTPRGATAEKSITIYPHDIIPLFYPYDDVLGVDLTMPFTRRIELAQEGTFSFEPYYFSRKNNLASSASYLWYVDGLPVQTQEERMLAIRPDKEASGRRTVTVVVDNTKRILQKTEASLQVVFDTRK
ncbi:MAG: hypothetical protein RIQ41_269 [Candidatus Parcubacteria bacterium]|jgi:hypothetical protein